VTSLLGSLQNPAPNPNSKSSNATANLNPNACYAYDAAYQCGDGTLQGNRSVVGSLATNRGWAIGNHTIDHLENYQPNGGWTGIPAAWHDTMNGGWLPCSMGPAAGNGPGDCMDVATWKQILPVNEAALKADYAIPAVTGFRAPRLEINDNGLNAIRAVGYEYDESLEEIQPQGYVDAAINANTDGATPQGFNWIPWPYTLDNGSPGVWNVQATNGQQWITSYPNGLWEVPTYEVYVPSANGLGKAIANTMLASDNPSNCMFPPGTPPDQMQHCFLGPGELAPGDSINEVTAFDFNTFIYCRMTPAQWLTVMQHTFKLRYYGNRTPLTYGAHPIEYTDPYDSFTLEQQANNYGYRDVIKFSTYQARQMAMQQFVQWIQSDPVFSKDTFFMSAHDLVTYMQHPFDKAGMPVAADQVATTQSNGIFTRLGWTTQGATIMPMGGNAANIAFNIPAAAPASGDPPPVVYAAAGVSPGALQGVTHIDIKYTTQVPFRIRLLTSDGSVSVTALLAGVGGERLARIRIKDFFPGPEADQMQVLGANLVDSNYMSKVTGIAIESAATLAAASGTPGAFVAGTYNTQIQQMTLHGVTTSALCQ
jgi:hypothetical protein